MGKAVARSLDTPDETRKFENGTLELVQAGSMLITRTRFEPGWKWSNDVKPIVGTDSCQVLHTGYCVSGRMQVRMDDGTDVELQAGDAYRVEPGHDGWVLGDETVTFIDFSEKMEEFAKPQA